jgi:hypothetical protein
MGLFEQAAVDAKAILEDASGFRRTLTLTSPAGTTSAVAGFATDIAEAVDPETGIIVSARRASATISLLTLPELPTAEADSSRKPWLLSWVDHAGQLSTWKIVEVRPDRAIGVVVLVLEAYDASTD